MTPKPSFWAAARGETTRTASHRYWLKWMIIK